MNKAFDTKKLNSEKAFVIDAYSSITPKIELTFDYFEEAEKYVKNQSWLSDGTNLRACTEEKAREKYPILFPADIEYKAGILANAKDGEMYRVELKDFNKVVTFSINKRANSGTQDHIIKIIDTSLSDKPLPPRIYDEVMEVLTSNKL
ncbi:hypothetical protein [Pseudoalteromonas sp. SR41-6]|uniref:hypothetical protein n=1 Tax=Pseudoalteromonas sp. SR41-6 TaxID=2760948 RepID=UPI00160179A7|nr:hypothetical protein [Pseudoalteromonas sp. SR41-6]MBB1333939.1 hypothetical protein [Pseudoalteromonas sp. SR41-6]